MEAHSDTARLERILAIAAEALDDSNLRFHLR
jgi:hypothetical protein